MMRFTAFSGAILRSTPALFSNSLIFFPRNDTPVSLANSTSESLLLLSPPAVRPMAYFEMKPASIAPHSSAKSLAP